MLIEEIKNKKESKEPGNSPLDQKEYDYSQTKISQFIKRIIPVHAKIE